MTEDKRRICVLCQMHTKHGGYRYANGVYIKGNEEIVIDDEVQVQLTEIRYEKKSFSCIAVLTS